MDKKLQKGIVAVLIANLVNVAFSLATNFLLPKYLSIESYAGIKEFQLYVSYVGLFHLGFVDGIYLKYGGKTLGKDVDKEFSTDLSTMCIFQYIDSAAVVFLLFSAQIFYTVIRSIYVNLYKVQRKQKVYFVKLVIILAIGFALKQYLGDWYLVYGKENKN